MPSAAVLEKPQISREVALKALQRIAERWGLQKSEVPRLLGGRSPRTVRHWYEHENGSPLERDVLERISHIVGIYDGLHRLFGDPQYADQWISEPNAAFGTTPREMLLSGNFTALVELRRYIDQALQL